MDVSDHLVRKNSSCVKQLAAAATATSVKAGRSYRQCDVCERDQARWFCAADEAYLCPQCDDSVHAANAVASKHERTLLVPEGILTSTMPTHFHGSKKRSFSGSSVSALGWHRGSRTKQRSTRGHHPHAPTKVSATADPAIPADNAQTEPASALNHTPTLKSLNLQHESAAHELSIFQPSDQELLQPFEYCNCSISSDRITVEADPQPILQDHQSLNLYAIKGVLESETPELGAREGEGEIAGLTMVAEDHNIRAMDDLSVAGDELGVFEMCYEHLINQSYGLEFASMGSAFKDMQNASNGEGDEECEELRDEGLCWKLKEEEGPDYGSEAEKLKLEADELLACALITGCKEENKEKIEEGAAVEKKVSLKLDYEDVLSAWSDRGSLWTDGRRPHIVPEDNREYDTAAPSCSILHPQIVSAAVQSCIHC